MTSMRTVAAALAALSLVLLIVVQFVPWATFHSDGGTVFGFNFPGADIDANTWSVKSSSGGASDSTTWYDSDADDYDGVNQIRIAIPLILAGLVLALVATLLGFLMRGAGGPIVTLIAALATTAGTILFAVGIHSFFGEADFKWAVSFYVAIAASAALLIGGIVGLVGGNQQAG